MKFFCRNKENCCNKDICFDCKIKIYKEMPYKFKAKKFKKFLRKYCNNIKFYKNNAGAKYYKFYYKEFEFIFYECQQCFCWYRVDDHPFRLSKQIEENENLLPTCSKKCMYKHRPKEPYKNNGPKIKYCNICKENTLHNGNICCICHPESDQHKTINYNKLFMNNLGPGECTSCHIFNKDRAINGLGKDGFENGGCDCFKINLQKMHSHLFNDESREKFYNSQFNYIQFNSLEENIQLQQFDNLKNKIGVWARWTDKNHEEYCLDVCKTISIGDEMLSSLRSFNSLIEDPNQLLDKYWKKKYKNQLIDAGAFDKENPGKINFILVAICKTEEEALMIETQYAHDNKAKYWSPQPGQSIIK